VPFYDGGMVSTIRNLLAYQEWADAAILRAVRDCAAAAEDETLCKGLHHTLGVQKFFLSLLLDVPFDVQKEMQPPKNVPELEERFREAHTQAAALASRLDEAALERQVDLPPLKMQLPLRDAALQMVMHSQHHRGQCASRLRVLGGTPPAMDYILWVKEQQGNSPDRRSD
jgi:uncharacterized damage-inducible protein DinB